MTRGGSNELVTVQQVADRLNVSDRKVYREWRNWKLPAVWVGRHLRFRVRDIDAYVERQTSQGPRPLSPMGRG